MDKPKWIEKLERESWQAELLISGGSIVTLFQINNISRDLFLFATYSMTFATEFMVMNLEAFIDKSINLLTYSFLAHLLLRGYWIGLIGLNSVFPDGINHTQDSAVKPFNKSFDDSTNLSQIIWLDKFCSLVFAICYSLMSTLIAVGCYTTLSIYFAKHFGEWFGRGTAALLLTFVVFGLLYILDFVLNGKLRRTKWIAYAYFPIYHLVNTLSLLFLFKRLNRTLFTNHNFKLGRFIPLGYCLAIMSIYYLQTRLQNEGSDLNISNALSASISDDALDEFLTIPEPYADSILTINIIHKAHYEDTLLLKYNSVNADKVDEFVEIESKTQLELIKSLYQLTIDSVRAMDVSWIEKKTRTQFGFLIKTLQVRVYVKHLSKGTHTLELMTNFSRFNSNSPAARIDFIKQ